MSRRPYPTHPVNFAVPRTKCELVNRIHMWSLDNGYAWTRSDLAQHKYEALRAIFYRIQTGDIKSKNKKRRTAKMVTYDEKTHELNLEAIEGAEQKIGSIFGKQPPRSALPSLFQVVKNRLFADVPPALDAPGRDREIDIINANADYLNREARYSIAASGLREIRREIKPTDAEINATLGGVDCNTVEMEADE